MINFTVNIVCQIFMIHKVTEIMILYHTCIYGNILQASANAENEDNVSEQRRQQGKRVRYGEVIQVYAHILYSLSATKVDLNRNFGD